MTRSQKISEVPPINGLTARSKQMRRQQSQVSATARMEYRWLAEIRFMLDSGDVIKSVKQNSLGKIYTFFGHAFLRIQAKMKTNFLEKR